MSQMYALINLRISPEGKQRLVEEVARRVKRKLPYANQSQLINAPCLLLDTPAIRTALDGLGTPQATAQR
ncbi:MAG: hypothetical protein Q8R78_02535 [Candidatus Omnitrophota bacterium]|nr:hypothetical protein [Candidatus Omnitrophota bacterium]